MMLSRRTILLGVSSLLCLPCLPAGATSSVDLDIGKPQKAGGTSFQNGIYTISGGGHGIGGTSDQFHFNKGTLTGDGTVVACVRGIGGTDAGTKSGVMLRNDGTSGSAFAAVVVSPGGVVFESRPRAERKCSVIQASRITAPVWVKLTREGSRLTGSYSHNGAAWIQIGRPQPVALGGVALAGVAVTSHDAARLSVSTFSDVAVTPNVDERYLHAEGNEIRDRAGRTVPLRGTNIGGWLVTEGWMCGQQDNGGRFALEELEARFGAAKAATLINAWRDNWFTDRDLDNVRSYGFNLIRIPFSWRNLQDAGGSWYRNAQGGIDFSRFDWVVQEAAKRGIYVIFDFHVWPGQQKNYGDVCQAGEPGAAQRAQAAAIWSAFAKHFKGNGTIAAYDLINEPTGSNDNYAAHRAFYAAIRAEEPERMLVAEWVNNADFPRLGWTNTMCSGHYPAGNKAEFDKFLGNLASHNEYSTTLPCFVGECKSDDSSSATRNAADMTQEMDRLNWAWTTWTYKTVNMGGWGLFNYDSSVNYDLSKDTYETILTKWTVGLSQWQKPALPVNYSLKSDIISGLKEGAVCSTPPPQ